MTSEFAEQMIDPSDQHPKITPIVRYLRWALDENASSKHARGNLKSSPKLYSNSNREPLGNSRPSRINIASANIYRLPIINDRQTYLRNCVSLLASISHLNRAFCITVRCLIVYRKPCVAYRVTQGKRGGSVSTRLWRTNKRLPFSSVPLWDSSSTIH